MGFYIAIAAASSMTFVDSLKLNPVQTMNHKLDIVRESKVVLTAFDEARNVASLTGNDPVSGGDMFATLNKAINLLVTTLERWSIIEPKFRNTLSAGSSEQAKVFDETVNRVASTRALLGQLYMKTNKNYLALSEFELACPAMWEFQVSSPTLQGEVRCFVFVLHSL